MEKIIAAEIKKATQITFDVISPKTVWVESVRKENWANTIVVIINNGQYKIIAHHPVYVI